MAKDQSNDRSRMALEYHARSPAGKIEVVPTKPCSSQRDLSSGVYAGRRGPPAERFTRTRRKPLTIRPGATWLEWLPTVLRFWV